MKLLNNASKFKKERMDWMALTENAKAYLEAFYSNGKLQDLTAQQAREALAGALVPEGIEIPPVAKVEERKVPVKNGEITVRIYTPEGQGPFSLFVYYHGGGWVLGNLETSDAGCRLIAEQTKRVVVSVDYRLAPEHKFPIPVEDSYTALCWAHEHADELNALSDDIVVGGDSAGGNLATVMAILCKEKNGPAIRAQALIYPVTNLDFTTDSYEAFADGFGLDKDLMIWFGEYYVNSEFDYKNPYISPLLYNDVSALPPAIIIAAENDVLLDEGAAYRDKLKSAGVEVEYVLLPGSNHGFFSNMAMFSEETKATVAAISEFLNKIAAKQ